MISFNSDVCMLKETKIVKSIGSTQWRPSTFLCSLMRELSINFILNVLSNDLAGRVLLFRYQRSPHGLIVLFNKKMSRTKTVLYLFNYYATIRNDDVYNTQSNHKLMV